MIKVKKLKRVNWKTVKRRSLTRKGLRMWKVKLWLLFLIEFVSSLMSFFFETLQKHSFIMKSFRNIWCFWRSIERWSDTVISRSHWFESQLLFGLNSNKNLPKRSSAKFYHFDCFLDESFVLFSQELQMSEGFL